MQDIERIVESGGRVMNSNAMIHFEVPYQPGNIVSLSGVTVEFRQVNKRKREVVVVKCQRGGTSLYMNRFFFISSLFQKNYGYELISRELGLYGTNRQTKEIMESMAAYHTAIQQCKAIKENGNVLCLVVADGSRPRTAALFATTTSWQVYSVDPQMSDEWIVGPYKTIVPNLHCHDKKIEDVLELLLDIHSGVDAVVIVGVHSHADLNATYTNVCTSLPTTPVLLVSIPCCRGYAHYVENETPIINFTEPAIPSDKNVVLAWSQRWPSAWHLRDQANRVDS